MGLQPAYINSLVDKVPQLPGVQADFYTMQNQSQTCNFSGGPA